MKKQKKQMIVLLVVLVILSVCFLLFKYVIKFEEKETENTLWNINTQDITHLCFIGETNEIELTKSDGKWTLRGYEEREVDDSAVNLCLGYVNKIVISEELGELENLSEYGLNSPENLITLNVNDTVYKLKIGDYNSGIGGYYIQINDQPQIYVWEQSSYLPFKYKNAENLLVAEETEEIEETEETVETEETEE